MYKKKEVSLFFLTGSHCAAKRRDEGSLSFGVNEENDNDDDDG